MRKVILSVIIFLTAFICLPNIAQGANMELTVNISSVKIPERSVMQLLPDRPNTEFVLYYSRVSAVASNGTIASSANMTNPNNWSNQPLMVNSHATVSFNYNTSLKPYNIYIEVQTIPQGSSDICKADCTLIVGGTGFYRTKGRIMGLSYPNYNSEPFGGNCPSTPCGCPLSSCAPDSNYSLTIALDPAIDPVTGLSHIITSGGNYYWRSPSLMEIK